MTLFVVTSQGMAWDCLGPCQRRLPLSEFADGYALPWGLEQWCRGCWSKQRGKAWGVYRKAVREGYLVRGESCQQCGATGHKIVGHHTDYRAAYAVEWLCGRCHGAVHRARKKETQNLRKLGVLLTGNNV